jgi:hypothetical protein
LTIVALLAMVVGLPWRLFAWLDRLWPTAGPVRLTVQVAVGGILMLGAWRAVGRIRRLLEAAFRDARRPSPG